MSDKYRYFSGKLESVIVFIEGITSVEDVFIETIPKNIQDFKANRIALYIKKGSTTLCRKTFFKTCELLLTFWHFQEVLAVRMQWFTK